MKRTLEGLNQFRHELDGQISSSTKQAIVEVEATADLSRFSLFELLVSKKRPWKLITYSKSSSKRTYLEQTFLQLNSALQKQLEIEDCDLAIKFLKFYKWKVIVKAKFGPMPMEIKRQRIGSFIFSCSADYTSS